MLFHSYEFLIFTSLSFFVYWFLLGRQLKAQNFFLLVISYVFYGWWDWRFLSLIMLSSLLDFFLANRIDSAITFKNTRKLYLIISIIANIGLLATFKYFNFFSQSFAAALDILGITIDPFTLSVVLPVGISFYTFQTLSYTIDVYRREMSATKDMVAFLAYVSFFPQLVAGPIERAKALLPQFFSKRVFSYQDGYDAIRLIIWGLFKKMVIADNCAEIVNSVFNQFQAASSLELIIGASLFAFQIYGDFSGYSDIASGTARLFGFKLMTNFKTPYFSRNIAEFWRRWHISLSSWFRDYLYLPMGGSKYSLHRTILNTVVIFVLSGLWHGANWTFVSWGALNAIYFMPLLITGTHRKYNDVATVVGYWPGIKSIISIISTYALTCFAWIFFRAENLQQAFEYILGIFIKNDFSIEIFSEIVALKCLAFVGFLVGVEWFFQNEQVPFFGSVKAWVSKLFYLFIVFFILLMRHFGITIEFIYFQF